MTEEILSGLAIIIVLGVGAQWLAWRLRLPSILLLLLAGFLAGPVTGLLHPDEILGDLLFPLVSVSVAVILFEGGLTLRLAELPRVGSVIFRLIGLGTVITGSIATLAARYVLDLNWSLSVLLGAILVVTGPTVIGPLLRQIRPQGQSGAVLKWEGILIDPVGAVLAVLIFEVILDGELAQAPGTIFSGALQTLVIGVVLSLIGAGLMIVLLRRFWVPDHLQNGVALLIAIGTFAISNRLHPEAGLLTVTLMGVFLANQKWVSIRHIVEFKENLRVLLIGSLFILLAARLQLADLVALGWPGLLFTSVLVLLARPLSVLISTWRSTLSWRERLFISWMAPRGIVAAAVASIFAFELAEVGHQGAEQLVFSTFLVIVITVTIYGLTAEPLARRLGLSEQNPQGILMIGAHAPARAMAAAIKKHGIRVVLLDKNRRNVAQTRQLGLEAYHGDALSESIWDDLDLTGIGRLMALTPNDEVNSLVALHFQEVFNRSDMYQLPTNSVENGNEHSPQHLRGRYLFAPGAHYRHLLESLNNGAAVEEQEFNKEFGYSDYLSKMGDRLLPLFVVNERKRLTIFAQGDQPIPKRGQTVISLVSDGTPENGGTPLR